VGPLHTRGASTLSSTGFCVSESLRRWYAGKRVFVTGHTGFKGSWLVRWLRDAGCNVSGYALAPEDGRPSLFALARIADGIESILADVRDRERLDGALRAAQPEIVFHLAAQSLVRRSYAHPVATFDTNVTGTAQMLDAIRGVASVRGVVVVTSDKCYENRDLERGYREDDPMGGHDPYSASKGCQELVTAAFRRSFFGDETAVCVASARAGNVIGGGDWSEDRLMADLMRAAAAGTSAGIRNPDAVRPWQHVVEPLRGYLMLGQRLVDSGREFAEAWNFGPDESDAVTVREVVARVVRTWPGVQADLAPQSNAPHEARALRLDNSKARARLGWTPALTLDETVTMTVEWYRSVHESPSTAPGMMERQWREYESLVDRRLASRAETHD
jgi:CDP-glucose 4,6-dehydratase